jgi:membrane protease YdiL (CAAX protease family)
MGESESPVGAESAPEPTIVASVVADSGLSGLITAAMFRQLLLCVAGWMFSGMAIWILFLDPLPKSGSSAWSGWRGRDVLLTLPATYCLRATAMYVWTILLFQRELRGRPPAIPITRNLGNLSWQMLACLVAVDAFALAPHGLGADALGVTPVGIGWLAAGLAVGMFCGPGLLLVGILLGRLTNDPLRLESRQVDFLAPRASGQVQPRAAVAGMLLLSVALAPCVEELLFRGVVYPGLRNELGVWVAIPLSALLFGLFHPKVGWEPVVFATGFGVAAALLVEGSGSLWPAVLAHMLVNSKLIAAYVRSFRAPLADQVGA